MKEKELVYCSSDYCKKQEIVKKTVVQIGWLIRCLRCGSSISLTEFKRKLKKNE